MVRIVLIQSVNIIVATGIIIGEEAYFLKIVLDLVGPIYNSLHNCA